VDFNVEPYYDDFEGDTGAKEQNYMRILFRPGYAVQARELTQMQSILQNQIKSFGDHIFQDGSPVEGGHLTLDKNVTSLFLQPTDNDIQDFTGQLIINSDGIGEKRATVLAVDDSDQTSTVAGALIVKQLTSDVFINSDNIEVSDEPSITATLLSANSTFIGSAVSMQQGIFYVDGYFVFVPEQTLVLETKSVTPTYRIGLEIDDNIIDESQDTNLLDPAQSSFNYQAPGATRYQFALNLTKRTLDSSDTSTFYELLRVENGEITKQVLYPLYSELNKTLARRTDDQSGSFTVKPFRVTTSEDPSNSSNYLINIEPGKAYVKGYEYETLGMTKISVPKARTSSISTDYDLSLDYGNYLGISGLKSGSNGMFDIASYQQLDLHLVPSANINTASALVYNRTRVATARIRNIEYVGSTPPAIYGSEPYYLYLTDINNLSVNVFNTGTRTDTSTINVGFNSSSYANAYVGVLLSIISGNNAGYSGKIVSYNAESRVATVSQDITTSGKFFTTTCNASSKIMLTFGVKDALSVVSRPNTSLGLTSVFASKQANTAYYACAEINSTGRNSAWGTQVYSTNYNKLLYKLPESYISYGSEMIGMTYYAKKSFTNKSFVSGQLTLSAPGDLPNPWEEFVFGYTASTVSPVIANKNLILTVRDSGTSGWSNGEVITFGVGANNIYQTSATSIRIDAGTGNFTADIITNIEVNFANTNARRTKTLYGNSQITSLRTTDTYLNGTVVTGAATVRIECSSTQSNGIVWFTGSTPLTKLKTPGSKQPLYLPDVIRVIAIYDSGNTAQQPSSTNAVDVTTRYIFDSGQTDNYYDHASLILRAGSQPPTGQVAVMLEVFDHTGTGFFNVDSYSQFAYENNKIPYYASAKSGAYALRDSIDFRPTRLKGTTAFTLDGVSTPYPYFNLEIEKYEFYLPRMDKLSLIADGTFKVTQGASSAYPKVPADPSDSMTLYNFTIPAYTGSAKEIPIQYIDNRRYTMKDIGILEKRIENLEYYTSLNLLETTAARQKVFNINGVEKAIYGFIADQFEGFNIADNKSEDLVCNIDKYNLSPYKIVEPIKFTIFSGTNYQINDKTFSLPYTEESCINQYAATQSITVQPYQFAQFEGNLILNPESDTWYSSSLVPEIIAPATDTIKRELPIGDEGVTPVAGSGSAIDGITRITIPPFLGGIWGDISQTIIANLTGFGSIARENWTVTETNTTDLERASSQTEASTAPINSGAGLNLRAGGTVEGSRPGGVTRGK